MSPLESERSALGILIGIPAYNEAATIQHVIDRIQHALPGYPIVVVDDGSTDQTAEKVRATPATLLRLPCNWGYSLAVETILRYAELNQYEALILIDADGQHDPDYLPGFLDAFKGSQCDMLIGSRYIESHDYQGNPPGRRVGMILFSRLTRVFTGKRIWDTTSGMKAINRQAIHTLLGWHFIDYHAEALVYLLRLGFVIGEYPITVQPRRHGTSMYNSLSHLWYPLKVILMLVIGMVQGSLYEEGRKQPK